MIFRAMVGIGLALLLASHQSELGFGERVTPLGAGISLPSLQNPLAASGRPRPGAECEDGACAAGSRTGQRSLAAVKAEIDASLKARGRPFYDLSSEIQPFPAVNPR
jgi:hypothetical protein